MKYCIKNDGGEYLRVVGGLFCPCAADIATQFDTAAAADAVIARRPFVVAPAPEPPPVNPYRNRYDYLVQNPETAIRRPAGSVGHALGRADLPEPVRPTVQAA